MENAAPMICFILAFPAVIGVIIWANRAATQAANEAWASAARQLRLAFHPGDFMKPSKIEGAMGGRHVVVETYTGGDRKGANTRFRVGFPALGLGLRISRSGIFAAFARHLGVGDIETGDPVFDGRFTVRGNSPARVRGFLTDEFRTAIDRFFTFHRDAVILDDGIETRVPGRVRDAGRIVGTVRSMADLARRLSESREEPVAEAIVVEEAPPTPPPEPPPRATAPPVAPPPPPPPPIVEPPSPAANPFEDLFAEGMTSLDTNQKFDAAYKNTTVRWKGTLKVAETYSFDSTFGRDGAKAVVEVHEIRFGFHKGAKVQAVVQVPPETAGDLRGRVGATVEVEGRLVRCDGFMRTLHLADGKVTA